MQTMKACMDRSGPRGFRRLSLLILAVLLSAGTGSPAHWELDREYQVKAVFLFNFAQFVAWPEGSFPEKEAPLVVGILGDDPFNSYLDEVVRGEKVNNHPISVKRYRRIEEIKDCHVLFVSPSESQRMPEILEGLKTRNILTVGESEGFSKQGGMVSFVRQKGKIRLKINLQAVQAADLTVSSKLLRLADIVEPGKG
jgi:hypothetical protein